MCKRHEITPAIPVRGVIDRMLPEIERLCIDGKTAAEIAVLLGLRNAAAVSGAVQRAKRPGKAKAPSSP